MGLPDLTWADLCCPVLSCVVRIDDDWKWDRMNLVPNLPCMQLAESIWAGGGGGEGVQKGGYSSRIQAPPGRS